MRHLISTAVAAGSLAAAVLAAGPAAAARPPHRLFTPATPAAADTYPNGRIPASALCPLGQPGQALRCDAARDFIRLKAAYRAYFGRPLLVTDSYRSYEAQVSCRARKGDLCAMPGTSNHGRGLAVDMAGSASTCGTAEHAWLQLHGSRYGWLWPPWANPTSGVKPGGECWHWQYRTMS